jgi:hypothetical protein
VKKVRYYRTWCGTYSSALSLVLLGWLRLLFLPSAWSNAWRMQKIERWNWPTFRWAEQRCECSPEIRGHCFPCYMKLDVPAHPHADYASTPAVAIEPPPPPFGYIEPGKPGADCVHCGHWRGCH